MKKKLLIISLFVIALLCTATALAELYPWPLDTVYVLNTGYLYGAKNKDGSTHLGIDITRTADNISSKGKPIYAPISGTANYFWCTKGGVLSSYGNFCEITSGNVMIRLCHMNEFPFGLELRYGNSPGPGGGTREAVPNGQGIPVSVGDIVGWVGEAGNTSGPHLHVEVLINGSRVNPTGYFDTTVCARDVGSGSTPIVIQPQVCSCIKDYFGTYEVTTNGAQLNVRAGHGDKTEKVGSLLKGTQVRVTAGNGEWAHIMYKGTTRYVNMKYLKKISDSVVVTTVTGGKTLHLAGSDVYTSEGEITPTQIEMPTIETPDCIVHIDNPHGDYNGSNHVEISGWIVSKHDLTYVMGECEAFGQINLTENLIDASDELAGAGYGNYPYRKRYRSVIDKKYLQPNTTYTMKVWAGLSNGDTSGVCSQRFNVTSIEPTVIRLTSPSATSLTGGKDTAVAGYILSLNPITDVLGRLDDFSDGQNALNFNVSFSEDPSRAASSDTYTYAYSFSGTIPVSSVSMKNVGITASVFITAIDENGVEHSAANTYPLNKVVRGNIGTYSFQFTNKSNEFPDGFLRMSGTETKTLTGTVYANAPIAHVGAAIAQWAGANNNNQVQLAAVINEITPPSGYSYAKTFKFTISAGDLCNIMGSNTVGHSDAGEQFTISLWTNLMNNEGKGDPYFFTDTPAIIGSYINMPSYTVKYDANGGKGAPGSHTFEHGANGKGATVSSTIPSRTGYTFLGWTTSKSSNVVKYVPGSSYKTNANVTLYAVWEEAKGIPTDLVSYDFTASVTIKNAPKVYKLVPSSKTRYRFTASGANGANVVIQNQSGDTVTSLSGDSSATKDVLLNDNQTYYLVVKPNKAGTTGNVSLNVLRSYDITFDAVDGSNAPSETVYQFAGESVTLPATIPTHAPTRITFVSEETASENVVEYPVEFNLWANSDYDTFEVFDPGETVQINRSINLKAQWSYEMLGDVAIPERAGYTFTGWVDEDGRAIDCDEELAFEDAAYYATWTPAIPLEGIKLSPKAMSLDVGDVARFTVSTIPSGAILPEVTWSSSNTDTASIDETGLFTIQAEGVSVITATTVNGEFSASAAVTVGSGEFTVTYDANGGEGAPQAATVRYGEAFQLSDTVPVWEGCNFMGWSYAPDDDDEALLQPGEAMTVDRDRTLYAYWELQTFLVVYNVNGGTGTPSPAIKFYGSPLVITRETPTREGYSFAGWARSATAEKPEFLPGDAYEENAYLHLYAVWRERPKAVSLNYGYLALERGESRDLRATVTPNAAADALLTWQSSDESVATVKNGRVTAVAAGQAVIRCAVADDPSLTADCRVAVGAPAQSGDAIARPETQVVSAAPGGTAALDIRFKSAYAAYAKLLFSYDESALELTGATAAGSHVTLGDHALVLAVSSGRIPDGTQATLTFRVREDAAPGTYGVDVIAMDCYTIDEIATGLYAVAADGAQVTCLEHIPALIAPVPATRDANGLGAGWVCAVCGETLIAPAVIEAGRCAWLPEGLKALEDEALAGLPLQQVTLPEGAERIGNGAFRDCDALLVAVIPASVTDIAANAFDGCDSLCIVTPEGSAAQKFAQENDIPCASK